MPEPSEDPSPVPTGDPLDDPTGAPAGAPASARPADPRRDHALLVGCTYADQPSRMGLQGCANDVALLADVLRDVLELEPEHLHLLVEGAEDPAAAPTHAHILGALAELRDSARAGDRVWVFLAGHGTQQPDGPDGDEADGWDEVFLPSDVGGTRRRGPHTFIERALVDDELQVAIEALLARGVEVVLLSDSCHSATLGRGGGDTRSRGIDPAAWDFGAPDLVGRGGARRSVPGPDVGARAGFVGLYAVQADEEAQETRLAVGGGEQRIQGIFTWSLARALATSGGDASFDDLLRLVGAGYSELGFHGIRPFLDGDRTARVRRSDAPPASAVLAELGAGGIELDGGLLHGLHPGTRVEVLTPDRERVLGELRVVDATPLRARCAVVEAGELADLVEHDRRPVRVVSTPVGTRPLRVHRVGAGRPAWLDDLATRDPGGARVTFVEAPEAADWRVEEEGGSWRLTPLGDPTGRRYRATAGDVARALLTVQRASTLLALPAATPDLPEGLEVQVLCDGAPLAPGAAVVPGSGLVLRAFNGTAEPLDLWVFWIDADLGVTRVFPDPDRSDASPFLAPARKSRQRTFDVRASEVQRIALDATQGTEHFLFLAVPPGTADLGFLATDRLDLASRGDQPLAARTWGDLAFGAEGDGEAPALQPGVRAELLSLHLTWEPAGSPAELDVRPVEAPTDGDPGSGLEADLGPDRGVPDAFVLGPTVHLHEVPGVRVVCDRPTSPRRLLFDLNGPATLDLSQDRALLRDLRGRTWGAELALGFDPDTGVRTAWYRTGTQARPRFDLVRVDTDGDGLADREHVHRDGAWTTNPDPAVPWLQVANLDFVRIAPRDPHAAEDALLELLRTLLISEDR